MEDAQQSWEEDDYARTPTAAVPIARAASDHVIASSAPPTDHGIARYYSSNHLRGCVTCLCGGVCHCVKTCIERLRRLRSDDEDSKLETGLIRSFGAVLNQPQSEHGNPLVEYVCGKVAGASSEQRIGNEEKSRRREKQKELACEHVCLL